MANFQVVSEYRPSGDQPKAIEALAEGVLRGDHAQTLLGVTGSGKTYTRDELRKLISGHLCRCTGYQNILNAVERAVNECSKLVGREDA